MAETEKTRRVTLADILEEMMKDDGLEPDTRRRAQELSPKFGVGCDRGKAKGRREDVPGVLGARD